MTAVSRLRAALDEYHGEGGLTWAEISIAPDDIEAVLDEREPLAGWERVVADKIEAERDELKATLGRVGEVAHRYAGWYDGSPEDGWRLERDLFAAIGEEVPG